jgi:hypothetical protein
MMYNDGTTPSGGQTQLPESFKAETFKGFKESIEVIGKESKNLLDTWATLDGLSASFTRNLNGSRERIVVMETAILGAAQSVMELSNGVITFEQALVNSTKILAEIQEATRTTFIGNKENIEQIYTTTQATGIASKDLISNFKKQGAALSSIPTTMQKVVDYTRSIGMNVKAVSSDVIKNLDKLNLYNFNNGVEGLTRMVAKAQLLYVPMDKVLQIADKVFDPEKAVDLSASLQRLGVATGDLLDPLRLMDLGQNNPEELTNQIVEMSKRFTYFNEENQKFEILPGAKRELREIADAMGMSSSELATMALQSSTLSDKMSKIRFPRLDTGPISEEQEMLIANLSELQTKGDFKGQYTVQLKEFDKDTGLETGDLIEKNVAELTETDIKLLGESAQPKELKEIASEQLSAMNRVANNTAIMASQGKKSLFATPTAQKTRREIYQESTLNADAVLRSFEKSIAPELDKKAEKILSTFKENLTNMLGGLINEGAGVPSINLGDIETALTNLSSDLSSGASDIGDALRKFKDGINPEKEKIKQERQKSLQGVQDAQDTGTYYQAIDNLRRNNANVSNPNLIDVLEEEESTPPQPNQTGGGPGAYNVNVSSPIPNVNISQPMANMSGEIKHQFNDLNIIVKIDAQPGVDTAQITDVMVKMLNRPEVIQSIMAKQTLITQNYGTTGGKVGTNTQTSGTPS